jgi:hypothetical protein
VRGARNIQNCLHVPYIRIVRPEYYNEVGRSPNCDNGAAPTDRRRVHREQCVSKKCRELVLDDNIAAAAGMQTSQGRCVCFSVQAESALAIKHIADDQTPLVSLLYVYYLYVRLYIIYTICVCVYMAQRLPGTNEFNFDIALCRLRDAAISLFFIHEYKRH